MEAVQEIKVETSVAPAEFVTAGNVHSTYADLAISTPPSSEPPRIWRICPRRDSDTIRFVMPSRSPHSTNVWLRRERRKLSGVADFGSGVWADENDSVEVHIFARELSASPGSPGSKWPPLRKQGVAFVEAGKEVASNPRGRDREAETQQTAGDGIGPKLCPEPMTKSGETATNRLFLVEPKDIPSMRRCHN
jgi:hypothetical protein